MQKAIILNIFANLIIFKPVLVMVGELLGVPHAAIVLTTIVLLFLTILFIGKLPLKLTLLFIVSLAIVAFLATASFRQSEYIYNAIFTINVLLVLALAGLHKNQINSHRDFFWRIALIVSLMASFIDAQFFQIFTNFGERNTLIGYDNPLWAGRDLAIVLFYFAITSKNGRKIEIAVLLGTMLFFLEARAMFILSLFICFVRFRLIYLAVGMAALSGIFYFLIQINPFSVSLRLAEWSNILTNIHHVPLFGFGVKNYADIGFTSLGVYPHNWILDLVLGYGLIGALFASWVGANLIRLLALKDGNQLHYLMVVPIVYVLAGLSQGSLVSGMLGLCLMPFGSRINSLLTSPVSYKLRVI